MTFQSVIAAIARTFTTITVERPVAIHHKQVPAPRLDDALHTRLRDEVTAMRSGDAAR